MSLEKYYIIEKKNISEDSAVYRIALNTKHSIYQGHFPKFPLLPGAIQIEIVQELLENALGESVLLIAAKNIKYLGMINPLENSNLIIDLKWNIADTIKLKATIKSTLEGNKTMLKYSAEYTK